MNLVFFLKMLADLCFYAIFAAFFASGYGLTGSILLQLGLVALSAALCRAAGERFSVPAAHIVPLLLCLPAFAFPAQTAGLVILVPAVLYAGWVVCSCRWNPAYFDSADQFLLSLKILPLPALIALALGQMKRAEQFSAPYLMVFLLSSVLMLRMLRHDEETLRQPRFRLMNGLSMAGLCLVSLGVASPLFRSLVGLALKAVWRVVSIPILAITVVVGGALGFLLETIIPDDFHFQPVQLEGMMPFQDGEEEQHMQEMIAEAEPNPAVTYVFTAIGIIIAIIFIVLLFRWLASKKHTLMHSRGNETRFSVAPAPAGEKPLTRLSARTPAMQVRYWYQQLLRRTQQEGGNLSPAMNTRQQEDVSGLVFKDHDALHRLRQLYLPARYHDEATEQDAREAKELFHRLKK